MYTSNECEADSVFQVPCLKIAVSKGLGFGIILGSVMVKLPQIVKIVMSKSGHGINVAAVTFELTAISFTWAYSVANSFPFSAWGEALFMAVQTTTIATLCFWYKEQTLQAILYVSGYLAIMLVLLSGATPLSILSAMQATNMPIVVLSKLIQAQTNYNNGHTGQLSAVTVFLLTLGSVARIFTTIQETGDAMMTWTYIIATATNALVAFQVLWYWKRTEEFVKKQQAKTE
ncbi:mannose-P-dolichol utilization defect 1 protein-like isoform X2 [Acanthaster planci]|uniref:Mannose-P-dolichol utilization defect 1 protein homolog n=1 Tax=Acanthaster planci TaxID=133434 RepID=A0A8B7YMB3_ACAPL|nr:mannose-P-dolichol utilization defect 1 protein-like isoform X2 [Acanthaster planci]